MPKNIKELFDNPEAEELLEKAADLFVNNNLEAAETVLWQVTEKFPDFFPGWAAYGDFLLNVGRPDKALVPLRKAVKLAVFEGIGHYLLGAAYLKVARFHLAERELEMAEKLLEEKADVKAHLGRAKVMLGKIREGRKLIAEALKDDPDNPFIYGDMAQSYVMEKNFDEALRWAESAKEKSDDPFFEENLASIRKLKGDFDHLPSEEQRAARREAVKGWNKGRIEALLSLGGGDNDLTQEDVAEIEEELRSLGLTGQITMVKDANDPKSRAATEFVKMHEEMGFGEGEKRKKFSSAEIRQLSEVIFGEAPPKDKKSALVRLAVSGCKAALEAIERFLEGEQPADLKLWAELAYDECRLLNRGSRRDEPSVAFRYLGH